LEEMARNFNFKFQNMRYRIKIFSLRRRYSDDPKNFYNFLSEVKERNPTGRV
jgi:hypothetical protein